MSQTIQSDARSRVEKVARMLPPDARDDFRTLMNEIVLANLTALSPGGNLIQPGGTQSNASAPPVGVTHSVTGANAVYSVAIQNPEGNTKPIYHELSYSPVVSFSKGVKTLPVTSNTSLQIPAPGGSYFFRLRSSYDKKSWTPYTLTDVNSISAGLVESSALSAGAAFNQTNYAVLSPTTAGAEAISISGPNGQFTPYTAVRGANQALRPSATIVNIPFGPNIYVGWDGAQYQTKNTLGEVLGDNLEPVGVVMVGSTTNGGGGTSGSNGGRLTQDPNTLFGTET